MRFPGIRLVEQSVQKFCRIRDCLEKKNKRKLSDCNSRALYFINAPTKNDELLLQAH